MEMGDREGKCGRAERLGGGSVEEGRGKGGGGGGLEGKSERELRS